MQPRLSILLTAWTAAQRINQLVTNELIATNAWTPRFATLVMINMREPLTPKAVAQAMGFPPTTMSDYLNELFEAGLIKRTPNPADGRSYLIRPTAKGRRAFERGSRASFRAQHLLEQNLERPLEEIEDAIDDLTRALDAALTAQAEAELARRGGYPGHTGG
jgi:MarR family transcriptional regulator, temperature-dependent positive regulator of motility